MAKVRQKFEGGRELGAALKALGNEMATKLARQATAAAAREVKQRAIELAPVADEPYVHEGVLVQPGNIGRNVVVKRLKPGETALTSEHVVVVRGKRRYGYASRVGALQEFGTVQASPQPFMRPAFEQRKEAAAAALRKTLKSGIDRANRKAKK